MRTKVLAGALLLAAIVAAAPGRADNITTGVCTVGTQPRACAGLFQEDNEEWLSNFVVAEAYDGDQAYLVYAGRSEHRTDPAFSDTGACASRSNPAGAAQDCVSLHEENGSVSYAVVYMYDGGVCLVLYPDGTFSECQI